MKRIYARSANQAGQAMVEFVISMTMVMSVLLLAIAMLGKFNDVRNRTLMGSRYVAWERTVWTDTDPQKNNARFATTTEGWSTLYGSAALAVHKTDAELKSEVMQRVMAGDGSPVTRADRKQSRLATSQPAMWRDYGGNPLLASAADLAVSTAEDGDTPSSRANLAIAQWPVGTATGGQYMAQLQPATRAQQSGTVSVSIAQDSDVLKRLWPKNNALPVFSGLTFSDTNVLMTNTWVPDGSSNNKALFSGAVPAANVALVPSGGYMGLQKYAPEIASLQFGRIQQDVVPADRLALMKFVDRLARCAYLAGALMTGSAIAGTSCNKTPVSALGTEAFGRDMIVNGVPTSIVGLQFAGTIDDVSKAFRSFWTSEDVPARGQASASGLLLSALDGRCLYVLTLAPQPEGSRTRGLMSVIRLGDRPPEHRIQDSAVPLPEGSKVISDVESRDPGQTGRTWLLDMPGSARLNAQRYRARLVLQGWVSLGRQPDYQSTSAQSVQGTAFAMQHDSDSVDVSFSDRDGRTVAVVNATRNR